MLLILDTNSNDANSPTPALANIVNSDGTILHKTGHDIDRFYSAVAQTSVVLVGCPFSWLV
jgi:hypothetical protein